MSQAPPLLRALQPDDALAVLELVHCVATCADTLLSTPDELQFTEAQERDYLSRFATTPGAVALGAWCGARLCGVLFIEPGARHRNRHVGTLGMSVHPDFWNQGIGRGLLTTALKQVAQVRILARVSLSVFSTNPHAIRLYEKAAFVHEGRRIGTVRVQENDVDELLMGWFPPRPAS